MSASLTSPAPLPSAPHRYDAVARALHWSMALLIAAAFVLGLAADEMPSVAKDVAVQAHILVGSSLVVLLGFRILWRLAHAAPPVPHLSATARRLATGGHLALYGLMAAVLAAGLATLFLRGRGIDLGLVQIPSPLAANRALSRSAKEVHETLSFALMGLAGLHVVAALWHQFVLRDHTMERMARPR